MKVLIVVVAPEIVIDWERTDWATPRLGHSYTDVSLTVRFCLES